MQNGGEQTRRTKYEEAVMYGRVAQQKQSRLKNWLLHPQFFSDEINEKTRLPAVLLLFFVWNTILGTVGGGGTRSTGKEWNHLYEHDGLGRMATVWQQFLFCFV
jgi:hypothetical protein